MIRRNFFPAIGAVLALQVAGCKREEIRVYTVAKESIAPAADADAQRTAQPTAPRPQLSYTVPPGWQDAGSNAMSLANFRIKTDAGEASVNITPLASMAGQETAVVNMWREQMGLQALDAGEVATALTPVEIGGDKGQLFEITGERDGKTTRIVTAFVHRDGASWFYKLQGPDAVVSAQKAAFIEFLKTVRIKAGSASAATVTDSGPSKPEFKWTVPEGWQTLAAGQMQVAKFAVPDRDGAKAEVSVSIFPSESGGTLANVNRWRRQLGLEAIEEAALKDCTSPIEGVNGAVLVDLKNDPRALLGAIVPRGGSWFFYKLLGDAPAVNAAREGFVRFVQSPP